MLTQKELEDLRQKALAATPGPWELIRAPQWYLFGKGCRIAKFDRRYSSKKRDAEFVAAADPVTVLKLLEMLENKHALTPDMERDWLESRGLKKPDTPRQESLIDIRQKLERAREAHPEFGGLICVLREVADLIKADEAGDPEEVRRQAIHVAVTALRLCEGR